jgi:hypothetical protein
MENNSEDSLDGGAVPLYENLEYSLFKYYKKFGLPLSLEQQSFKNFILSLTHIYYSDNFYIDRTTFLDSKKRKQVNKYILEMNKVYNSMKSLSSSKIPTYEDYHRYARSRVEERIVELSPKDISTVRNNFETVYSLRDSTSPVLETSNCSTGSLDDDLTDTKYCLTLKNSIDFFYDSIKDSNNLFIAKDSLTNFSSFNYVKLNLLNLIDSSKYNYIGFSDYSFSTVNKQGKPSKIIHFYFVFLNISCNKIVVVSNNGNLVCPPAHYEAFKINSVLLNHLYYFNGSERSLMVYKYQDYLYFSRYTKYELEQVDAIKDIIKDFEEMSLIQDENKIITAIPIFVGANSFINKRYQKLLTDRVRSSASMIRPSESISKFLFESKPELPRELLGLISYKNGPNYSIYVDLDKLKSSGLESVLDREINHLNTIYKDIKNVSDYKRFTDEQLRELSPDEIETELKKFEEKLFNLTDEQKTFFNQEFGFGNDTQLQNIRDNYIISKKSDEKPNFFSNLDLIDKISLERTNNYLKYLPEITKLLKDINLIDLIKSGPLDSSQLLSRISQDIILNILSKRQLLLGNFDVIRNFREDRLFYINDSFFFPFKYLDMEYPKELFWSPVLNKIYVNLLTERNLIFPTRLIKNIDDDAYNHYNEDNPQELLGVIQIRLENQKDLFLFIMKKIPNPAMDWDSAKLEFDYYDFRGNITIINQTLGNFKRWGYIEIYELLNYYKTYKPEKKLHIYEIQKDYSLASFVGKDNTSEYLFSEYTLPEIKTKYDEMGLASPESKDELNKLKEVEFVHDSNTKKFIVRYIPESQELMIGGSKKDNNFEPSLYNIFVLQEVKIGKNKYDKELKFYSSVDKENYKYFINMNKLEESLLNRYEMLFRMNYKETPLEEYSIKLKTKFVYKEVMTIFHLFFILFDFSNYENILSISANFRIIEVIRYYFKNKNLQHLYFVKEYDSVEKKIFINEQINKIKEIYDFKNQHIDKKLKNKFSLMFFDLIYTYSIDRQGYQQYIKTIKKSEKDNLFLIKKAYDYLDNLEINGTMIVYLHSILNKETLLLLQNIAICFDKTFIFDADDFINSRLYKSVFFIFSEYKGKTSKLLYLTTNFVKSIKTYFKNNIAKSLYYISLSKYIRENINNKKIINSIAKQNSIYSYELAKMLKLDVYDKNNDIKNIFISSLQSLFGFNINQFFQLANHNNLTLTLIKNNQNIPKDIKNIIDSLKNSFTQINLRNHDIYDNVKKFIRLCDNTLSKDLFKNNIFLTSGIPVTKAWIKLYEVLFVTRIFDFVNSDIKIFFMCETTGIQVLSTLFYINKWFPDKKIMWNATCNKEKFIQNLEVGDTFDFLNKYKKQWLFGKNGLDDIINENNTKFYKKICSDYNTIIGDCSLFYSINSTMDEKIFIVNKHFANILFILYNLKDGGNCIFRQMFNFEYKIILDMLYILYGSFEKIEIYKPTQNEFSQEVFIICTNYKKILKQNDYDLLFKLLNSKNILETSIIVEYDDEFIIKFSHILSKIISKFNESIERELYYTDFWNELKNVDENIINKFSKNKNVEWINYFINRNKS